VFIAGPGALDQYMVTHPQYILQTPPEHALLAPDNLHILLDHLRCALFELPLQVGEAFGQSVDTEELLAFLEEGGDAHRAGSRFHWLGEGYPADDVSLRTASPDRVVIQEQQRSRAVVIGEVDRASAPRLVHPGAIYLHEGVPYLVQTLDWEEGVAHVEAANVGYYTQPVSREDLTVLAEHAREQVGGTARAWGDVQVRSQVVGYRKVKWYTHETLGQGEVTLPAQEMETTAYWLTFQPHLLESLQARGLWRSESIANYGPDWPQQRDRALARDEYRCRRCHAPKRPDQPLHVHHVRPFRTFGYVPGINEAYREANRLENLITLCPRCHRLAEADARLRSGFSGAAHVLAGLAPLFLMAAPGDIGQVVEAPSAHTGLPTITLYDNVPGGIGLAERLYEVHKDLLAAALERVLSCDCEHGCPACVGPVLVEEEGETSTKGLTQALLEEAQYE